MRVAYVLLLLALTVLPATSHATDFPRPAQLEPNVRFWTSVFTEYSRDQVVLHDDVDLDKIYRVLDFRRQRARGMSDTALDAHRRQETNRAVTELKASLRRLRAGARDETLTADEQAIKKLFAGDETPRAYGLAIDRVRAQRGIRERFEEGLSRAKRYLPEMERIFRQEGLPVALTRLPLVESSFDVRAYSKVGAAGVWQFMPRTGRRFMTVGQLVDERLDPFIATRAAARFLRENYDTLGTWPLAVTAYNHGPYGMQRAVKKLGTTDIGTIVTRYDGRTFGFSSRNFYAELLAAIDVERESEKHFGPIVPEPTPDTAIVRLAHPVGIVAASKLAGTTRDDLVELNPALLPPVTSGRRDVPSGYRLRIPSARAEGFEKRLALHAAERRATRVASTDGETFSYRVRSGDNLTVIAQRYGVTVGALRRENRMGRSSLIHAGKILKIPGARRHRVQRGQTLSHIAQRYGVSVASLRRANGMGKSSFLRAGQVLRIPGES